MHPHSTLTQSSVVCAVSSTLSSLTKNEFTSIFEEGKVKKRGGGEDLELQRTRLDVCAARRLNLDHVGRFVNQWCYFV